MPTMPPRCCLHAEPDRKLACRRGSRGVTARAYLHCFRARGVARHHFRRLSRCTFHRRPAERTSDIVESLLSEAATSLGRSALHNFSPVLESCTLNRLPRRTTMDDSATATANKDDDPSAEPTLIFLARVTSPPVDNLYWDYERDER